MECDRPLTIFKSQGGAAPKHYVAFPKTPNNYQL